MLEAQHARKAPCAALRSVADGRNSVAGQAANGLREGSHLDGVTQRRARAVALDGVDGLGGVRDTTCRVRIELLRFRNETRNAREVRCEESVYKYCNGSLRAHCSGCAA